MKRLKKDQIYLLLFLLCTNFTLYPHGYAGDTPVKLPSGFRNIERLFANPYQETLSVSSYDLTFKQTSTQAIERAGTSKSSCYCAISLNGSGQPDILCTPTQPFYQVNTGWMPAYQLKPGAILACEQGTCNVSNVRFIKQPLTVYALSIPNTHTFFVSYHAVLTHNIALPLALSCGLGVSFGAGAAAGGAAGGFFGPVTVIGGCVVGGLVGIATAMISDHYGKRYRLSFNEQTFERYFSDAEQPQGDDPSPPPSPTQGDPTGPEDPKERDQKKPRTIEELTKSLERGNKTKGKTKQFVKQGTYEDAVKDFMNLHPKDIRPIKYGQLGKLPDGRMANVRTESSAKAPTLEVQEKIGAQKTKIRYIT